MAWQCEGAPAHEILNAAEAIATAGSWDALTMKHVALRARLSRALLYVYFNDKAELQVFVCAGSRR